MQAQCCSCETASDDRLTEAIDEVIRVAADRGTAFPGDVSDNENSIAAGTYTLHQSHFVIPFSHARACQE
jgi:hypothetical protein